MSGQSDIEHLQELLLQLSPRNAELINRLERSRLTLEFMLAGISRPTSHQEMDHSEPAEGPTDGHERCR